MNNLPREILRYIGQQIPPNFRFTFRNINRYTRGTVDYTFLFNSITLTTVEQIEYFQNHPGFARLVRNLVVLEILEHQTNRREFLHFFPGAETIRVERSQRSQRPRQPNVDWPIDTVIAVRAQPQIVHDFRHCDLVLQIVSNQLGNNITTLNINFNLDRDSGETMISLVGMPQLATVHFTRPFFELVQLETMHRNCQTIQTLTLHQARIRRFTHPDLIDTYEPVNLSTLAISFYSGTGGTDGTGGNGVGYMCRYIMQKYQQLQHINYYGNWWNRTTPERRRIARELGYDNFLAFINNIQNPVP